MAKYLDTKEQEKRLFKRTEGYAANVRILYEKAFGEIIDLVKGTELEDGKPFSFSGYGYGDEVNGILRGLYSEVYQTIRSGIEKEWLSSNENNDGLVKAVFGESSIEDSHFARFFKRNMEAMDAFFSRKNSDHGLNLSQRVWNYTGQFREELENTLDLAIGEGTPANRMAARIKQYLLDPDRWYRRFRVKIGEEEIYDEEGNLIGVKPVYGRKWKRRVWDPAAGSYKWIDDNPKHYHPGRGVYRSSSRNAQRLARTETNIAYRTADFMRWQQLDFIVAIEIKLSNNHPVDDICDTLKGVYPKTFKWTGWHPNCRCFQVPVLASEMEMDDMLDAVLDGKSPSSVKCAGRVKRLPSAFTQWMDDNEDRIAEATSKGTLPYFIRDNQRLINPPSAKEIAKERHDARTEEQVEAIRKAWSERRAVRHYGNNILRIMGGISDVDTSELSEALLHPDLAAILSAAKKLKAIGKEIYSLSYIDDPMKVAKHFSFADAKAVNKAVSDKLAQWDALSLEDQKKKLEFEIYEYFGKNMNNVQQKYPTWQVSQQAYEKRYAEVLDELEWRMINRKHDELATFKTKSIIYKNLLSELESAIIAKDKDRSHVLIEKLILKRDELEQKAQKRAGAKMGLLTDREIEDLLDDFNSNSVSEMDDLLRPQIKELWADLTDEERTILTKYTQTYSYLNEPLRGIPYFGGRSQSEYENDLPIITNAIAKCKSKKHMVVRRGTNDYRINALNKNLSEVSVGDTFVDGGFLSTAAHRTKGFFMNYEMVIVVPKGSQGVFAEAFSHYTDELKFHYEKVDGKNKLWDGKSKESIGGEFEWIGQRGCEFKVLKKEGNRIYLQMIGQLKSQIGQ